MSGFLLWTPDAARARASPSLPSRSLRRRCASRSPSGDGRPSPPRCCVCPPAALAGCRSVFAPLAPRREAGRLVHRTLGEHNAIAQARISPRRSSSSRSYCFPNGTHHRSHMGYIVLVSGENLYWRTRRQLGVPRKHSETLISARFPIMDTGRCARAPRHPPRGHAPALNR